jgi:hypothetical protein
MAPWSLLSLVAAGILVTLKPEYSLWQSYAWTAAAFLSIILVCRFVYNAILYPNYLTPLKYLPTPLVSAEDPHSPYLSEPKSRTVIGSLEIPIQFTSNLQENVRVSGLKQFLMMASFDITPWATWKGFL